MNGVTCIYTGAVVLLVDYNCVVVADLFSVGDTHTLIQWNAEQETWLNSAPYLGRPITHHVQSTNGGYHHTRRGVTVVDNRVVGVTEHARK